MVYDGNSQGELQFTVLRIDESFKIDRSWYTWEMVSGDPDVEDKLDFRNEYYDVPADLGISLMSASLARRLSSSLLEFNAVFNNP